MEPLNIILLGRSGSGKGTQGKLLAKKFSLKYVGTGHLLRFLAKEKNFLSKRLREDLNRGKLAPTWLVQYLWLMELKKVKPKQGIIFDGTPRKLKEAKFLDVVLDWFGRKSLLVFLIDISRREALRRLLKRARKDDTRYAIDKRLDWFDNDVMPIVRYYEKTGRLMKINGEQSIEGVFREILKKLK